MSSNNSEIDARSDHFYVLPFESKRDSPPNFPHLCSSPHIQFPPFIKTGSFRLDEFTFSPYFRKTFIVAIRAERN